MLSPESLSTDDRRRSIALSYVNAAFWSLGNGLAGTTIIIYLARELGAPQIALGVAALRAAPQLIGVLRLGAPALMRVLADRARFCIGSFQLSALVLLLIPTFIAPGRLPSAAVALKVLVGLWCVYHLLQYVGTIALWAWLADLVPLKVRGVFIGRRNQWILWGGIAGMLASGALTWCWTAVFTAHFAWIGYALAICVGAAAMFLATLPLKRMAPAAGRGASGLDPSALSASGPGPALASLLRPLKDGRYLRLIGVGVWLSFFNGVTQSAQFLYPASVLGLSALAMQSMSMMLELGQSAVSPALGRWIDRLGNRPVMAACQLLVAAGPLFYLAATPAQPWWICGASVVWIAYAGLNIGLPSLMLKLAPADDRAAYVASYFAVTGVAFALSTLGGGHLQDSWGHARWIAGHLGWTACRVGFYPTMFVIGTLGRLAGALWLLTLIEPRSAAA